MRILTIHARKFRYKALSQALDKPEALTGENKEGFFENVLVVFTSVEEGDNDKVVEKAVAEILDVANRVKPKTILLYPYAHLSSDLASPSQALEIMKLLEQRLRSRIDLEVRRAPFGWYKEFMLDCYGHPLSELSKTIRITEGGEVVRRELKKEFYILTPDGKVYDPEKFDYDKYPDLKILVDKEVFGKELPGGVNRVNDYCRKFGFEWEPMSDHGHMRYGPHAVVIMDSIMQYSWNVVRSLGIPVYRVMGTNMFNLSEKPVLEHALLFGDRLYELKVDNEKFVLRYAACHQQFAMLRDWIISYKNLPFGMFEVADSYRLEQRGELNLCFRLRKFYMPDLHILNKDLDEAIKMSRIVQDKILEEIAKIGRKYVALYNVTSDFFEKHRDVLIEFVRRENYPVLVSVIPSGIYYWVLNVEYHIIDNLNRPREIATFQIDIGNGKRFNITYTDEKGEKHHPVIIHTAIIGGIERFIYTIFDTAALMEREGKTPYIPTWLAPVQVRIIPIKNKYLDYAEKVAEKIENAGFRVDIDDRGESLGKKIRDAGREWIPYIVVIGEREVKSNTINVRIRRTNDQKVMVTDELIRILEEETKNYPRVSLTMPKYLSKRPIPSYHA
ncbi:threonine--tRNA ligase [Staphylothermus hellenicus]|uniref:Threonine--tRNA ligase n=1 Tax=Staphylothermus hellenicus (strain DSM 12710 / JCM 10830 / BK20S6-10-b1 / P8) TaxID=591019 RepID=D7D9X9_STAHD|nr:threonine--tRNA ligase [Staphylothermus hellenicus]ADI32575.1 threonyl-tRNA synthetase [Staphylothermus hellenicus DSM 12710]